MRYSKGHNEWAETAAGRRSPADRERAALAAARIRDNHSGSKQDRRELARMERIVSGADNDDSPSLGGTFKSTRKTPARVATPKSGMKLSKRDLDRLVKQCSELGKEAADADWEGDDLLDDPTPGTGDPTMFSNSVEYPDYYGTLLRSWQDGYHEQAAHLRVEGPNTVLSGP